MGISFFKKYFLSIALIFSITLLISACHTMEPLENKTKLTKEEKTVIILKSKDKKKEMAKYRKAVNAHRKNQSETTKQMMKADKKKQRKNNRIHQHSFWDRLFNNHCNKK